MTKVHLITFSFTLSKKHFTPAIRVIILSFDKSTPFGSPVVPLVYIIVQISFLLLVTNSYWLSPPCSKQIWAQNLAVVVRQLSSIKQQKGS